MDELGKNMSTNQDAEVPHCKADECKRSAIRAKQNGDATISQITC